MRTMFEVSEKEREIADCLAECSRFELSGDFEESQFSTNRRERSPARRLAVGSESALRVNS